MASESRRLSILSDDEVEGLYGLPRFTDYDRQLYFDLSPAEKVAAGNICTASVAAHLILELGYFKAGHQMVALLIAWTILLGISGLVDELYDTVSNLVVIA